jgi:hypothetical protein
MTSMGKGGTLKRHNPGTDRGLQPQIEDDSLFHAKHYRTI